MRRTSGRLRPCLHRGIAEAERLYLPLIPELAGVLRGVEIIERTTVNAWDEKRVVDAVKATGRKKLIVTGISTDVCLAFPAMAALRELCSHRRVRGLYSDSS